MKETNTYNNVGLPSLLTDEEFKEYYEQFKMGDMFARDLIISHNLCLVVKLITVKFGETQYDIDDLISIGNIGLIKAVDTYDYKKNHKFSTYASKCIINEVLMILRNDKKNKVIEKQEKTLRIEENTNYNNEYLGKQKTKQKIKRYVTK